MTPPRAGSRLALGVLLVLAIAAVGSALASRREADLREVRTNVDSLRATILALEESRGQAPMPCGVESWAWEALVADLRELGDCGRTYMGRESTTRGRYWVEVAPGGVDFAVQGLARRGRLVLRVQATRTEPARVVGEVAQ